MASIVNQLTLFSIVVFFLNSGCMIQAAPTSIPPATPTNTSTPILVIPGRCEIFPPGECQPFTSDECVNDQQCQDIYLDYPGLKCCTNYCGIRVCDLPIDIPAISVESHEAKEEVYITEYVCPAENQLFECPSEEDFLNECVQDSDCAQEYPGRGYKCCSDRCGDRFCEQPVSRTVRRMKTGMGGI